MQTTGASGERSTVREASAGSGDAELLRRFVAQRDAAAMTEIVDRHGPLVLGLCRSVLRNEQDAADAFQSVFLVLLKNASSIGKPASLASWLYGVAYRVAIRARAQAARRRRQESAGAAMTSSVPAASVEAAEAETAQLIHQELAAMPEQLRLPLILCGLQGKSRDEAAQELGWTAGSVKGRLERGRAQLEARLTKRGVVLPSAALTGVLLQQASSPVPAGLAASTVKALLVVAAGKTILGGIVSANAAALTQGVLISMKLAKLKMTALVAAGLLFIGGSSVVIVYTAKEMLAARQQPGDMISVMRPDGSTYLISRTEVAADTVAAEPVASALQVASPNGAYQGVVGVVVNDTQSRAYAIRTPQGTFLVDGTPPATPAPTDPPLEQASANLRLLALAMHKYHDKHGTFPFPATRNAEGQPLLSWRVELLPYLGEESLYSQFRHDEPWDSPHNLPLVERMPAVFDSAAVNGKSPGETFFQVFVGPGTVFPNVGATRSISQITDGTSTTLLIVDAANPVPWTKPEDLVYDPNQSLPKLGGIEPDNVCGVFASGGFIGLTPDIHESTLHAMITADGGEVFGR